MCGIVGYSSPISRPDLERAIASIGHRGPDETGEFLSDDQDVGLGHARLSIVDLSSAGSQPMTSEDGRLTLAYNGELYDIDRFREKINAGGRNLIGHSDTEVLLRMIENQGLDCLEELNGIFAFALYEQKDRVLTIVRDKFGVKPLYYSVDRSGFFFSSEIKGLVAMGAQLGQLDAASVARYNSYLWCPGNGTPVKNVRKLGPGEALAVRNGVILRHWRWYRQPATRPQSSGRTAPDTIGRTAAHLRAAVRRQMVADVPIGAFLSGGLDSSAVVAFASEVEPKIRCFTIDTGKPPEGTPYDLPYARRVAQHLSVPLDVVSVDSERMAKDLVGMIEQLDEPLADPAALNVLYISQLARSEGIKVLLSGTGGDDLFTGYRRHRAIQLRRLLRLVPQRVLSRVEAATARLDRHSPILRRAAKFLAGSTLTGDQMIANYFKWIDDDTLFTLYTAEFREAIGPTRLDDPMEEYLFELPKGAGDIERILALEQRFFLVDHNLTYTDKMSMAVGVEVRVPFLDVELVEFAATIPSKLKQRGKTGKWILKKAMEPYLPADIIYRPKTGFGAPLRSWLRSELRELMEELLSRRSLESRGIFEYPAVRALIDRSNSGEIDGYYTIFSIMCIEIWCRKFLDRASPGVDAKFKSSYRAGVGTA